ncbi:MAG: 6-pyruvoyl-tetrahydropterin synthase-related protein, partial [Chloroflexota bacterium]
MRRVRLVLLLVTATLPAIIFLWQDGYFASSDGMIHLYRLFELDRALHEGVLFPRWFPLSGFGYGLPVLNYYPPLTYYFAEAFHLAGVGYIAAIKLTIAASFVIAAFSMFLFAREWLNEGAAFVAAIAYTYSPYLLSDAYVRGNFPEMLAISVLPFALWVFARALVDHASSFVLLCSISFAAIILTHHLTAMQFAALLLAYLAFLFFCEHGSHSAVGGSVASQENG